MKLISRRNLLIAAGVIGGGLLVGTIGVGTWIGTFDRRAQQRSGLPDAEADQLLSDWIVIQPDGAVRILSPSTEMGQGAQTSLLQIVLDELDADPAKTTIELAPALPEFSHSAVIAGILEEQGVPTWSMSFLERLAGRVGYLANLQFTGGSTAIMYIGWRSFRRSAAAARMMLAEAGAGALGVPVSEVTTRDGQVVHAASGRSVGYGEVATAAADLPMPQEPTYKKRQDYKYIGQLHPRVDLPDKVFGKPVYGMDVRVEGMRYAAVAPPPVAMGQVTGVANRAAIEAMPGVEAVVVLDDAVAVVADKPWRAEWAARKAVVTAAPPEGGPFTDADVKARRWSELESAVSEIATVGDGAPRLTGDNAVQAKYFMPFAAHTPMEPMNATVWEEGGAIHVASGVQGMLSGRRAAANALGVGLEDVVFHPMSMGGGFGRRNGLVGVGMNYVDQACRIQKAVGGAVKMIWSREAGVRLSTYRPADAAVMEAELGSDGRIARWHARMWAPIPLPAEGLPPYAIPHVSLLTTQSSPELSFGYWRAVHLNPVVYFTECLVDECAAKAGVDPLQYRIDMAKDGRARRVLETVAAMADYANRPQGGDRAYGVAYMHAWNAHVAQVVDVSLVNGKPRVHRVWCAADCGTAVNPGSVEAQVQGGIHYGLSSALYGAITFDEQGAIRQSNFHDYRAVMFSDAPRIAVTLLDSPDAPVGGAGEIGTPAAAPAVANAIAQIADRPRDLPFAT